MSLLELRDVNKVFHALGREPVHALRDIDLTVEAGTMTGLVGESGSGKTTIIKSIMGLEKPTSGTIAYDGINIPEARGATLRRIRREVQFVFQDPTSSLNPRMTVEKLVGEGLLVHQIEPDRKRRRARVAELLMQVGLSDRDLDRYPRSFSGGQRQRIAIARALAVGPKLLICDEPVSALDVSVQAQVLNLLQDMQEDLGFTVLFIAHDLAVVRQICSRVAVIQLGRIVEEGPSEMVLAHPSHPYTKALLAAVPNPDPAAARRRARERLEEEKVA
ncbi:ABC transporter ATP-binding protein [Microbacterium sp. 22242]|uniref:ABC transporter ATP-binding protein n=1 Tax=Microbacterium sp. 22242 TaxID=3453896 RepID=UPI003F839EB7